MQPAEQPDASHMSALRSFIRQLLRYAPGTLVPAVVGLLSSFTFTRIFTTREYGQYSVIVSVTALAAALISQWLQQAVNRFLPSEKVADALLRLKHGVALAIYLLASAVAACVVLMTPLGMLFVNPEWRTMLLPAGALVLTTVAFAPLSTVLQAEMRAGSYTLYQVAIVVARYSLSVLIAVTWYRNPAALVWVSAVVIAIAVPFIWRHAGMPSLRDIHKNWRTGLIVARELAHYGVPMVGWFLAAVLLDAGDRFVIQYVRGAAEVGIYAANYSMVTGAVGLIAAPVLLTAHPFLMQSWGEGHQERTADWLGVIVEWLAAAGILLVGLMSVFSRDVAYFLLGPAFREGAHIMPVVLGGVVMWQLGMYAHKPLEFMGRTRLMLQLAMSVACANVVLNFVFVPFLGYTAAAYTTLGCYLLYCVLAGCAGRRYLNWHIDWRRLALVTFTAFIGFAVVAIARISIHQQFGYIPGFLAAVAGACSTVLLVLMIFMRPFLRQLLTGKAPTANRAQF